ncbi:hypothetical protein CHUAL_000036 [Chamberlinius hualienensis]
MLVEYARENRITKFSLRGSVMFSEGKSYSLYDNKETICISNCGDELDLNTPRIVAPAPKLNEANGSVLDIAFSQSKKKLLRTPPGVTFNQNK